VCSDGLFPSAILVDRLREFDWDPVENHILITSKNMVVLADIPDRILALIIADNIKKSEDSARAQRLKEILQE
jgi:hypothetical protein